MSVCEHGSTHDPVYPGQMGGILVNVRGHHIRVTIVSGEVPDHCDQREDRELVGKEPPSCGTQPRPQQGKAVLMRTVLGTHCQ